MGMDLLDAVLLGALQGLTEFLPVSSSAHLVAAQHMLGVRSPGVVLEVALHCGTLLAILVVFRQRLRALVRDGCAGGWLWLTGRGVAATERAPLFPTAAAIVVGTVPAALAGVLLGGAIEAAFESLAAAGAFLIATGVLLLGSRRARPGEVVRVGVMRGLLVGCAQATALLPGVSRSGATIVAARFLGVERAEAARFSFVLAVPALVGAGGLQVVRAARAPGAEPLAFGAVLVGALVSAAVGWLCLVWLLRVVQRGRLHLFALYCLPAGGLMLAAGLLR